MKKDDGITCLAIDILSRAVKDYKDLKKKGVESVISKKRGSYSLEDIEIFLSSDWCDALLRTTGTNLKKEEIWKKLQTVC